MKFKGAYCYIFIGFIVIVGGTFFEDHSVSFFQPLVIVPNKKKKPRKSNYFNYCHSVFPKLKLVRAKKCG